MSDTRATLALSMVEVTQPAARPNWAYRQSVNAMELHQMRPGIVPGGLFPDYELRDQTGTKRTLSELRGADPMVLVPQSDDPVHAS